MHKIRATRGNSAVSEWVSEWHIYDCRQLKLVLPIISLYSARLSTLCHMNVCTYIRLYVHHPSEFFFFSSDVSLAASQLHGSFCTFCTRHFRLDLHSAGCCCLRNDLFLAPQRFPHFPTHGHKNCYDSSGWGMPGKRFNKIKREGSAEAVVFVAHS